LATPRKRFILDQTDTFQTDTTQTDKIVEEVLEAITVTEHFPGI
jgi:hypothetical protein